MKIVRSVKEPKPYTFADITVGDVFQIGELIYMVTEPWCREHMKINAICLVGLSEGYHTWCDPGDIIIPLKATLHVERK